MLSCCLYTFSYVFSIIHSSYFVVNSFLNTHRQTQENFRINMMSLRPGPTKCEFQFLVLKAFKCFSCLLHRKIAKSVVGDIIGSTSDILEISTVGFEIFTPSSSTLSVVFVLRTALCPPLRVLSYNNAKEFTASIPPRLFDFTAMKIYNRRII